MTVEECANDLAEIFKAAWLRKEVTTQEVADVVAGKLRALIYAETGRILTILAELFVKAVEEGDALATVWLQECRERIEGASDMPVCDAVECIRRAESERNVVIFKRYLQASRDAWGPGASNPPKPSVYIDDILATSPGKQGA